jgi:hypothetical protein
MEAGACDNPTDDDDVMAGGEDGAVSPTRETGSESELSKIEEEAAARRSSSWADVRCAAACMLDNAGVLTVTFLTVEMSFALNRVPMDRDVKHSTPFMAHTGMVARLDAVWGTLAAALQGYGDVDRVYCTGHSLGGAYAMVCVGHEGAASGRDVKPIRDRNRSLAAHGRPPTDHGDLCPGSGLCWPRMMVGGGSATSDCVP